MNIDKKSILWFLLSMLLIVSLFGCSPIEETDSSWDSDSSSGFWENDDTQNTPLPSQTEEPGSENWTIMIYMNGSNLESEAGEATANLQSLLSVSLPESINVILYTGGTAYWQNDVISPYYNQIWSVENGELVLLETLDAKSIGESATLSEFISYGQTYYPADKKALLFWNHGGGSVIGFGSDELFDYDGLWLSEMSSAFEDSFDGQKFDLIGFDACLMASIETASTIEPYAKYMVASEEVEPGGGWDYTYSFSQLAQNPGMSGEQFGIEITDGYYNKYAGTTAEGIITCSVIDLSNIPAIEDLLAVFSEDLNGSIVTRENMAMLAKARQSAESYGEDPGTVSFDMVDLYGLVDMQEGADETVSSQLLTAIEDAVVYEVSGYQRLYSYGLSVYFPFAAKEYFDYSLSIYDGIDFCPEYKAFAAEFASKLTNQEYLNDVPDYDSALFEDAGADTGEEDYSEIGSYYVQLTDEEMEYLYYVYCVLGWYMDDGSLIDLGYDSDLTIDYSDNTIHDNFGGWWTGLNGQPVAVYVMEETDEYIIYNIPVLYNGEKAVVKGAWIWDTTYEENGYYIYNGIFYTNDEYAPPSTKFAIDLQIGDEITPLYTTLYAEDGYDGYYVGDPFYVDENGLYLELIWLPDGYYEYGFMFIDCYGEVHYSESTGFELY